MYPSCCIKPAVFCSSSSLLLVLGGYIRKIYQRVPLPTVLGLAYLPLIRTCLTFAINHEPSGGKKTLLDEVSLESCPASARRDLPMSCIRAKQLTRLSRFEVKFKIMLANGHKNGQLLRVHVVRAWPCASKDV